MAATTTRGCDLAHGSGYVVVGGPGGYSLDIELIRSDPVGCSVSVEKLSRLARAARFVSDPTGIDCGERCSAEYPLGSQITISTQDPGAVLICPGEEQPTNLCTFAIQKQGIKVGADRYGPSYTAIWGSGRDDIWAFAPGGSVAHWNGLRWADVITGNRYPLVSVWGSGPNDVWAGGPVATLLYLNGAVWTLRNNNNSGASIFSDIYDIWGSGPNDVWAVANNTFGGEILHWNGTTWEVFGPGVSSGGKNLSGIWGTGPNDIWAVGDQIILHWDGSSWSTIPGITRASGLARVWGSSANDVWTVASGPTAQGSILRWDGTIWRNVPHQASSLTAVLWGSGPSDIWTVGVDPGSAARTPMHWDGAAWSFVPTNTKTTVNAYWGTGPRDVWAAGDDHTILHWDGTAWTVAY